MSKTITIRVPDDLYENLVQLASKNGIKISTLIRTRLQEDSTQPKEQVLLKIWNGEQRKKRRVSLSDTELEVLTQNAERFGLSRSAYVRSRCVYKPGTYVEVDRGLLADCFRELRRQGVISGGMIPKVDCCVTAIQKGVRNVVIMDGRVPHSILMELLTDEGAGTWIREG